MSKITRIPGINETGSQEAATLFLLSTAAVEHLEAMADREESEASYQVTKRYLLEVAAPNALIALAGLTGYEQSSALASHIISANNSHEPAAWKVSAIAKLAQELAVAVSLGSTYLADAARGF
jgi:hypothetical protein